MMNEEMQIKLKKSLVNHEGRKKYAYADTKGNITIGIGYNLTARGMPDSWIDSQYEQDATYFYNQLCQFTWYKNLNQDRQIILIDMSFMGFQKFLGFKKLIAALEAGDYKKASFEMLDSEWAKDVKTRATNLSQGMLTGVYNV